MKNDINTHVTIYTISTYDDTQNDGQEHCTGGSYISRGRAITELANWLTTRLRMRQDIAYAFSNDINHQEMHDAVKWGTGDEFPVYRKSEKDILEYVKDEIGSCGCYFIFNEDWNESFMFSLDENDLELDSQEETDEVISQMTNNTEGKED